ncbi:MAG: Gfo/Idh/MocA family oxidoreductase [Chloroflexi bacterium]|nr:Gfo/Idh/MocA family oxidoreductase [Chloroflexota bacterium]
MGTMDHVNLAIVGCGGMGTRHLYGMKEYASIVGDVREHPVFRLVAVCDPNERNANLLADTAATELGERPRVFLDVEAMLAATPELDAVDITTEPRLHHNLAAELLAAGKHVLVEKPMALTVAGCNKMMAAAARARRVLAVAENYRRDPLVRLTHALLEGGAIGERWMLVDASVSSGGRIVITPWRHKKAYGGTLLDVGVHNVDLMLYGFGPVEQVYAQIALFDRIRKGMRRQGSGGSGGSGRGGRGGPSPSSIYTITNANAGMPDEVEPDVEDSAVATLRFANGALGQWTLSHAGHGQGFGKKVYYGSRGSLEPAPPRTGRGPQLSLDGRREPVPPEEMLALVPNFSVDEGTARLFGGTRLAAYEFDAMAIDRKIQAAVLIDFGRAIVTGAAPEVGGVEGRHAVAVVNALFESARLNRPVSVAAVEADDPTVSGWQHALDAEIGLA